MGSIRPSRRPERAPGRVPARPSRAPTARGMLRPGSGLPPARHNGHRPVRWAQAHRSIPLAGPGGSCRAGPRKVRPPPPHAPPRDPTRHPKHTAPAQPACADAARARRPERRLKPPSPARPPSPRRCALATAARRRAAARRGAVRSPVHVARGPAPPAQAPPLPSLGRRGPLLGRPWAAPARTLTPWCVWAAPPVAAPHPSPDGAAARGARARRRAGPAALAQPPPPPAPPVLAARRPLLTPPPPCTHRRLRGAGGGSEWPPPGGRAARVRPPGAQVGCRGRWSRGRGRRAGRGARGGTCVRVCPHTCPGCRGGSCIHMRWSFFTILSARSAVLSLRARTHASTRHSFDHKSALGQLGRLVERWRHQHLEHDKGAVSCQR